MCPIDIPYSYEFARYGKCIGEANEPYLDHGGRLTWWNNSSNSTYAYVILRKIEPVPKYIPFTVETFRPHRDRWVRDKKTGKESRITIFNWQKNNIFALSEWYHFSEALEEIEFINADGSVEPCGQKVEG